MNKKTEEHKKRHILLHKHMDELVADYMSHTNKMPSQTNLMELIEWSCEQTKNPTESEVSSGDGE